MPVRSYYEDMEHTPRALIIGGGVGGPAASLFLRRAGIESRIFEAAPKNRDAAGDLTSRQARAGIPRLATARCQTNGRGGMI
jgi:2-polyprenyl-6-methoxyphenol hydroxylase-like FAD-dependent oxidoreductase